jgi:hypothetical protein
MTWLHTGDVAKRAENPGRRSSHRKVSSEERKRRSSEEAKSRENELAIITDHEGTVERNKSIVSGMETASSETARRTQ